MARGKILRLIGGCLGFLFLLALAPLDRPFAGEFTVRERLSGGGERRFQIFSPEKTFAQAICRKDGDSQVFEVRDSQGASYVISRLRKRHWGMELFVNDESGHRLGHLKEKIQIGLVRDRAIWEVRNAEGALLALSTPQDLLSTQWNLSDARDGNRLDLSRPAISLSDYWKVRLSTHLNWDRRFILALALYRVASDAERRR